MLTDLLSKYDIKVYKDKKGFSCWAFQEHTLYTIPLNGEEEIKFDKQDYNPKFVFDEYDWKGYYGFQYGTGSTTTWEPTSMTMAGFKTISSTDFKLILGEAHSQIADFVVEECEIPKEKGKQMTFTGNIIDTHGVAWKIMCNSYDEQIRREGIEKGTAVSVLLTMIDKNLFQLRAYDIKPYKDQKQAKDMILRQTAARLEKLPELPKVPETIENCYGELVDVHQVNEWCEEGCVICGDPVMPWEEGPEDEPVVLKKGVCCQDCWIDYEGSLRNGKDGWAKEFMG